MLHSRSIGSQIHPGQIGVAGECVALLPVHQKTNLRDLGKVGVQGADDRKQGERLGLDAGRVGFDKRSAQVDDGDRARDDLIRFQRQVMKNISFTPLLAAIGCLELGRA